MQRQRYFRRTVLGATFARYYLLAGERTVEAVQISRPDGIEIPEPPFLRWALKPRDHSPIRRPAINPPLQAHKRCPRCRQVKPRGEFALRGVSRRLQSWCIACYSAHKRSRTHATDKLA